MSKSKKTGVCLVIILGLTLLIPLILFNDQAAIFAVPEQRVTYSLFIHPYLNVYLFWVSVVLFIILFVGFFAVLLFPKKEKALTIKDTNGQLRLQPKSIESYVAATLDQSQFVTKPKIKVRMTNNKLAVKIVGQLGGTAETIPRTEQMLAKMKADIQQLLGVTEQKIMITLDFIDYTDKSKKKPRVE